MGEEEVLKKAYEYFENNIMSKVEGRFDRKTMRELFGKMLEAVQLVTGCGDRCTADHVLATIWAELILLPQSLLAAEKDKKVIVEKLKLLAVLVYLMGRDFLERTVELATEIVEEGL